MVENKNSVLHSAMIYAIPLGVFWIVRYLIFMLGTRSVMLNGLSFLLLPFTIVLAYYATKKYREESGGKISFFRAWGFGILLYFFAALLVSVLHYIYYEYVAASNYLVDALEQAKAFIRSSNVSPETLEALEKMQAPSSIAMTLYDIIGNVFYGIFLSLPVAIIISAGGTPQLPVNNIHKSENEE